MGSDLTTKRQMYLDQLGECGSEDEVERLWAIGLKLVAPELHDVFNNASQVVREFLTEDQFLSKLIDINANTPPQSRPEKLKEFLQEKCHEFIKGWEDILKKVQATPYKTKTEARGGFWGWIFRLKKTSREIDAEREAEFKMELDKKINELRVERANREVEKAGITIALSLLEVIPYFSKVLEITNHAQVAISEYTSTISPQVDRCLTSFETHRQFLRNRPHGAAADHINVFEELYGLVESLCETKQNIGNAKVDLTGKVRMLNQDQQSLNFILLKHSCQSTFLGYLYTKAFPLSTNKWSKVGTGVLLGLSALAVVYGIRRQWVTWRTGREAKEICNKLDEANDKIVILVRRQGPRG